jgi:hypothetical protein
VAVEDYLTVNTKRLAMLLPLVSYQMVLAVECFVTAFILTHERLLVRFPMTTSLIFGTHAVAPIVDGSSISGAPLQNKYNRSLLDGDKQKANFLLGLNLSEKIHHLSSQTTMTGQSVILQLFHLFCSD